MIEFNPTHEIREGVDVVWQIPPSPKAILYLAHSAYGTPFSYWPPHPNAPPCTGTPEHKVATRDALERGFAVIATKSVTGEWESWPPSSIDIQNTVKILKAWSGEHGLEDLPVSAWGTSAGGDYVSSLAVAVKMHSLIIMISTGRPAAFQSAVLGEYPPTLFVPMINDERTFSGVKENIETLKEKGIPCAIQEAPPLKVQSHFFAEHIDELDEQQSAKLHSLFVEYGIVAEDNTLNRVAKDIEIEACLRKADILPTINESQRQQDEETLLEAKRSQLNQAADRGPEGGRAGGRGPPPGGRGGGRGPPPGGRGGGAPSGGPPPCHPLANGVSNQLKVAEGRHTLTARHNKAVFAWLEGEGWSPIVKPQ